jgi:hypothetical protein
METILPELLVGIGGSLLLLVMPTRLLKSRAIAFLLALVAVGAAYLMTHDGFGNFSINIPAAPRVTGSTSDLVRIGSAAAIALLVLVFARANAPIEPRSGAGPFTHPRVKPIFGDRFFKIVWGATLIVGALMLANGVEFLRVAMTYAVIYVSGMILAALDGGLEGINVRLAEAEDENQEVAVLPIVRAWTATYRVGMVVVVVTIWAALAYLIYHGL